MLTATQLQALAPKTLSFPELQTALDAEIMTECTSRLRRLNGPGGWALRYCRELDKTVDAWRFKDAAELDAIGATRSNLHFESPEDEWWPLVSGTNFYHFEFPAYGSDCQYWLSASGLRDIDGRRNTDGTSVFDHYRVVLRRVASPTNERSSISTIIPPSSAVDNSANTIWGPSLF